GENGSATASAVGGVLPYTYEWSNGENTAMATALTAGTHTVTITDADGNVSSCMVTVSEPPELTCEVAVTSTETCNVGNDGVITVTAMGGTGDLEYSIDDENFQEENFFENLAAGTYTVTVRDENGCTSTCLV